MEIFEKKKIGEKKLKQQMKVPASEKEKASA